MTPVPGSAPSRGGSGCRASATSHAGHRGGRLWEKGKDLVDSALARAALGTADAVPGPVVMRLSLIHI
eukprot:8115535-Pyramimonas_sp.AAC.1